MNKPSRPNPSLHAFATRIGEGALVDVSVNHITDVTGRSGSAIYLDISSAPAPERKYAADTSSVWTKGSTIKLLFGQQRMGGDGLLSLIAVHMTPSGIRQFLASIEAVINPTFDELAKREQLEPDELPRTLPDTAPGQTVGLSANMISVAVSGDAACLDFYNASPFVIKALESAPKKMALDPVVRVDLPTSLFLGLVAVLKSLARSFPPLPQLRSDSRE